MQFRQLSEEEFRNFSINHKYKSFFQTVETGLLKEKEGFKTHLLGLIKNNEVIAATILVSTKVFLGKNKFYAPRGYLIDFNNLKLLEFFSISLKKYVIDNNGLYIKIDPYVPYRERNIDGILVEGGFNNQPIINNLISLGYIHYGFTLSNSKTEQVRWMFVLDIENKTEDNILANMETTTRQLIKKSIKMGLTIKELKMSDINKFKTIMNHTSERRGFIDKPLSYYKNMYDVFSKSNMTKLMVIELDIEKHIEILKKEKIEVENHIREKEKLINNNGKININKTINLINLLKENLYHLDKKIEEVDSNKKKYGNIVFISSSLFITYGDEVIYLYGGNYKDFMHLNGQYYLQWEIIKYCINNNFKRYNFYGISGNFDTNDSQYGIYNFKRGFNGNVVELIGEFDLPTSKLYYLYKLLSKIKRVIKR